MSHPFQLIAGNALLRTREDPVNPVWDHDLNVVLPTQDMQHAAIAMHHWPEYRPTPLYSLPAMASTLQLGQLWVKDESQRFGRGGVKALGAPYGLLTLLGEALLLPPELIADGQAHDRCAAYTAIAATDGNHGLALAWAAKQFGCAAHIVLGQGVDEGRIQRIRDCGAVVEVIPGTYDDAVLLAEQRAREDNHTLLITDTDYHGGLPVTRAIMAGYSVLAQEMAESLHLTPPTHVFLHCGVGGLAAAVAAGLWHVLDHAPNVITVEPTRAACLFASLAQGQMMQVPGDLSTRMIGLSCGLPSQPAWQILRRCASGAVTVSDELSLQVQHTLARGIGSDPQILSGDTGIAGLTGLWLAAQNPLLRQAFELNENSRVLVISSEGPQPGQVI
ncbi:diaminopropionate ammonia-lyase [Pokkaliibacter sp. MBI-7]|uniref:diaminopropionate ammonia-lyase n=1 Tax=Pokkaliibacter sp. MBI-7 TaxID=3040600 RepID=UPI00244C8FD5|nr:diaminopropionate ammonia-lyase [Pokkaliibacter sp. MBI-7]MDH2434862.1 diaminopropionate ammonia-lyase [Pokkaliibacter sp. MBI-7]